MHDHSRVSYDCLLQPACGAGDSARPCSTVETKPARTLWKMQPACNMLIKLFAGDAQQSRRGKFLCLSEAAPSCDEALIFRELLRKEEHARQRRSLATHEGARHQCRVAANGGLEERSRERGASEEHWNASSDTIGAPNGCSQRSRWRMDARSAEEEGDAAAQEDPSLLLLPGCALSAVPGAPNAGGAHPTDPPPHHPLASSREDLPPLFHGATITLSQGGVPYVASGSTFLLTDPDDCVNSTDKRTHLVAEHAYSQSFRFRSDVAGGLHVAALSPPFAEGFSLVNASSFAVETLWSVSVGPKDCDDENAAVVRMRCSAGGWSTIIAEASLVPDSVLEWPRPPCAAPSALSLPSRECHLASRSLGNYDGDVEPACNFRASNSSTTALDDQPLATSRCGSALTDRKHFKRADRESANHADSGHRSDRMHLCQRQKISERMLNHSSVLRKSRASVFNAKSKECVANAMIRNKLKVLCRRTLALWAKQASISMRKGSVTAERPEQARALLAERCIIGSESVLHGSALLTSTADAKWRQRLAARESWCINSWLLARRSWHQDKERLRVCSRRHNRATLTASTRCFHLAFSRAQQMLQIADKFHTALHGRCTIFASVLFAWHDVIDMQRSCEQNIVGRTRSSNVHSGIILWRSRCRLLHECHKKREHKTRAQKVEVLKTWNNSARSREHCHHLIESFTRRFARLRCYWSLECLHIAHEQKKRRQRSVAFAHRRAMRRLFSLWLERLKKRLQECSGTDTSVLGMHEDEHELAMPPSRNLHDDESSSDDDELSFAICDEASPSSAATSQAQRWYTSRLKKRSLCSLRKNVIACKSMVRRELILCTACLERSRKRVLSHLQRGLQFYVRTFKAPCRWQKKRVLRTAVQAWTSVHSSGLQECEGIVHDASKRHSVQAWRRAAVLRRTGNRCRMIAGHLPMRRALSAIMHYNHLAQAKQRQWYHFKLLKSRARPCVVAIQSHLWVSRLTSDVRKILGTRSQRSHSKRAWACWNAARDLWQLHWRCIRTDRHQVLTLLAEACTTSRERRKAFASLRKHFDNIQIIFVLSLLRRGLSEPYGSSMQSLEPEVMAHTKRLETVADKLAGERGRRLRQNNAFHRWRSIASEPQLPDGTPNSASPSRAPTVLRSWVHKFTCAKIERRLRLKQIIMLRRNALLALEVKRSRLNYLRKITKYRHASEASAILQQLCKLLRICMHTRNMQARRWKHVHLEVFECWFHRLRARREAVAASENGKRLLSTCSFCWRKHSPLGERSRIDDYGWKRESEILRQAALSLAQQREDGSDPLLRLRLLNAASDHGCKPASRSLHIWYDAIRLRVMTCQREREIARIRNRGYLPEALRIWTHALQGHRRDSQDSTDIRDSSSDSTLLISYLRSARQSGAWTTGTVWEHIGATAKDSLLTQRSGIIKGQKPTPVNMRTCEHLTSAPFASDVESDRTPHRECFATADKANDVLQTSACTTQFSVGSEYPAEVSPSATVRGSSDQRDNSVGTGQEVSGTGRVDLPVGGPGLPEETVRTADEHEAVKSPACGLATDETAADVIGYSVAKAGKSASPTVRHVAFTAPETGPSPGDGFAGIDWEQYQAEGTDQWCGLELQMKVGAGMPRASERRPHTNNARTPNSMVGLEFAYKETEAECDADRSDLWAMQLSMDSMQEGGGAIRMYRRGFEQAAQRAIEAKKSRRRKERVLNALVEYAERNKKADEAEREANKKRQERAMKKWVKVVEEERRRRNVVEENVKQKRVATSSFIQWYWQAFAHAIEEAEEVMLRGGTTHSSWRVEGLQLDEGAH